MDNSIKLRELIDKDDIAFLIEDTFVPMLSRGRIVGPLSSNEVEEKRKDYQAKVDELPEDQRSKYEFIVYDITRSQ